MSALLVAFLVSLACYPLVFFFARRAGIVDHPNHRKIHRKPVPRAGGYQVMAGLAAGFFIARPALGGCLLPILFAIFLVGAVEDWREMSSRLRLVLVAALVGALAWRYPFPLDNGLFVLPVLPSRLFMAIALLGVVNAYNFIDGVNGLASGLGVISLFGLSFIALMHGDADLAALALAGAGAAAGFFVFNFWSGRMFMGDSGSYLVGATVGATALLLLARHEAITPWSLVLACAVPVFDTLFAIYRRKKRRKSIFAADRLHLHHRLIRRYRGRRRAVLTLLAVQAVLAALALPLSGRPLPGALVTVLAFFCLGRLWFRPLTVRGRVLL